jgi:hypothetical protein
MLRMNGLTNRRLRTETVFVELVDVVASLGRLEVDTPMLDHMRNDWYLGRGVHGLFVLGSMGLVRLPN